VAGAQVNEADEAQDALQSGEDFRFEEAGQHQEPALDTVRTCHAEQHADYAAREVLKWGPHNLKVRT
jgi:hypothetical protein